MALAAASRTGIRRLAGLSIRRLAGLSIRRLAGLSPVVMVQRADLAEVRAALEAAEAAAALWQARTAALEARLLRQDERLAEADRVTMDLRARLVCLHGKLANTAAAARYQRFATALGDRLH